MGKGEGNTDKSDDSDTPQQEVKPETVEKDEEADKEVKASEPKQEKNEEEKDTKKVDNLRKVIKVDKKDNGEAETEDAKPGSRENLEQKRAILQSIKDFDFQIKKNQEEITGVNKKLDSVTKDLDDLVSLYEIVSEQMNPFVGLSKVTKKRIDALENFTKEIDDLKNRMGDIESFAVKAGADLNTIRDKRQEPKEETKTIEEKIEEETEKEKLESDHEIKEEEIVDTVDKKIQEEQTEPMKVRNEEITPEPNIQENKPETPVDNQSIPVQPITPEYSAQQPNENNYSEVPTEASIPESITYAHDSYDYLDEVIEKSLKMMSIETKMDRIIDEFIENLKA